MSFQATPEEFDEKIKRCEGILDYSFSDKTLIRRALTHPSTLDEEPVDESYERLEFLGDSIVGSTVAEEIFGRFPGMDEGGMTRIKVSLVSGATLAAVSDSLGMGECIVFGGSETGTGKRGLHSALENVFESITAALYLDGGIEAAQTFVARTLFPHIDGALAEVPENPKSALQEVLQARHVTPSYEVTEVDGPPHDRTFSVRVLADGKVIGHGSGRSKKEAEAAAATDALPKAGLGG